ncbi:unnamed protein product [Blepharisma stoltei]|uniref:Sfi1 spindle body domain-containing protein n=1 Tax=Blepharisma stoltei TaxID=1481888 RepID=A0AAU9IFT6_9CILI|nr:unnamed protein product [Blepharisma stoltei]
MENEIQESQMINSTEKSASNSEVNKIETINQPRKINLIYRPLSVTKKPQTLKSWIKSRLMKNALKLWKAYHSQKVLIEENEYVALKFWSSNCYCKGFKSWIEFCGNRKRIKDLLNSARIIRMNQWRKEALQLWKKFKEEAKFQKLANTKYIKRLARLSIACWKRFCVDKKVMRRKIAYSNRHYMINARKKTIKSLKYALEIQRWKTNTMPSIRKLYLKNLLRKSLRGWRLVLIRNSTIIRKRKAIQKNHPLFLVGSCFHLWIKRYLLKTKIAYKRQKVEEICENNFKKKIFEDWVKALLKKRSLHEKDGKATEIIRVREGNRVQQEALRNWTNSYRSKVAYKLMKKRADKIRNIKLLKKIMKAFALNKFIIRMKRAILNDAISFYNKNLAKLALNQLKELIILEDLKRRRFFTSVKFWSKTTYKKGLSAWSQFTNYRKSKKELENHAKELHYDKLRRESMALWLKVGLIWKEKKESMLREDSREKEEKSWKLVRKYANRWLEKWRIKKDKREQIKEKPSKMPPLQSINPTWVDNASAAKKQRRPPRRLNDAQQPTNQAKPETSEFSNELSRNIGINLSSMIKRPIRAASPAATNIDMNLSSMIRMPIRAPSPAAMTEKLEMTPIVHSRSISQFDSPKTEKPHNIEDRIEQIEAKLLELKFNKEKLKEFQSNLKQNPENKSLERLVKEIKQKLQEELPNVRALYDELQYLKRL